MCDLAPDQQVIATEELVECKTDLTHSAEYLQLNRELPCRDCCHAKKDPIQIISFCKSPDQVKDSAELVDTKLLQNQQNITKSKKKQLKMIKENPEYDKDFPATEIDKVVHETADENHDCISWKYRPEQN